jgi:hypothetical protein
MEVYAYSTLEKGFEIPEDAGSGGSRVAWRQDAGKVEVWVPLSDDTKVKRDVSVAIGKRKLTLRVADPSGDGEEDVISLTDEALMHPVRADDSSWEVLSDEVDNAVADRWLLVTLAKDTSYNNWVSPIAVGAEAADAAIAASGGIVIGAGERDQRVLTAQQLASYQRLRSMPYTDHVDLYLRRGSKAAGGEAEGEEPGTGDWERCWYVGKVAAAKGVSPVAAIEAQAPLIVGHARLLLPSIFGDVARDTASASAAAAAAAAAASSDVSFWYAPGDTELQVAQDQIPLRSAAGASSHDRSMVPSSAIDVGFEHESHAPDEKGFFCRRDEEGEPLGEAVQANFAPPSTIPEFRVGEKVDV